jgi:hypothetical protein
MTCRDTEREMLEAVLRGSRSLRGASADHLRACSACARQWELELRTSRLLEGSRGSERLSRAASLRLEEAIRRSAAARPRGGPVWMPAAAATVLTVLALAVGILYVPHGTSGLSGARTVAAVPDAPARVEGPAPGARVPVENEGMGPAALERASLAPQPVNEASHAIAPEPPSAPDGRSGPPPRAMRRDPIARDTHVASGTDRPRGVPSAPSGGGARTRPGDGLAEIPMTLEVASVGFTMDVAMGSSPLHTDVVDSAPSTGPEDWPVSAAVRSSSITTSRSEVTPR